jgi:hypothetical protein
MVRHRLWVLLWVILWSHVLLVLLILLCHSDREYSEAESRNSSGWSNYNGFRMERKRTKHPTSKGREGGKQKKRSADDIPETQKVYRTRCLDY